MTRRNQALIRNIFGRRPTSNREFWRHHFAAIKRIEARDAYFEHRRCQADAANWRHTVLITEQPRSVEVFEGRSSVHAIFEFESGKLLSVSKRHGDTYPNVRFAEHLKR